ncbi:MAG: HEAT repeat domain-containing protein [Labilithrix sp.]|nr:HEAT repeat domain-containing protein [Labilithrix sp.]
MNRKRWIWTAAALLTLTTAGALSTRVRDAVSASPHGATAAEIGFRTKWPVGSALRYELSWKTQMLVSAQGDEVAERMATGGASELDAVLVLKVAKVSQHETTLLASLEGIKTAKFSVENGSGRHDADLEAVRTALEGKSVALEVDDRGRLVSMRTPADAHAMLGDVMKALATELTFELAEDDAITWTAEEPTTIGKALGDYRYERTGDQYVVERTRRGYTSVHAVDIQKHAPDSDGFTRLTFTRDGVLQSITGREDVRVAHAQETFAAATQISLSFVESAPFVFGGDEELASYRIHAHEDDESDERADLALVGSFGRKDLAALVAAYAAGGAPTRGALAKAAAFLRLNPKECETLEAMFARDQSARAKNIVFDVLVSAGSKEAQAAMMRLLDSPPARHDPEAHRQLVQRFALVVRPTTDALAYIRELERKASSSGDTALSHAALVTRGAVLGQLRKTGDTTAEEEARALLDRARGDLSKSTPEDRVVLVMAVGNLEHPRASEALTNLSSDDKPEVRAGVAIALRHNDDRDAPKLLMKLMSDAEPFVARSAIESHLSRDLSPRELETLTDLVKSNGTNAGADLALGTAIGAHASKAPGAVREILETLIARAPDEGGHRGRLRATLEGLPPT